MNVIVETSMSSSSRSLIYKSYNLDDRLFPLDKPKQPYKDNIRIPSANIKFTSTSFRNRKESVTFVRFSFLFRGEYIYKLYSSYQCTYIVLILQCQGIHSQGRLNTIIGSREKQCTGGPTNNFQEYKCKQQNQCLNIKKHAVQQRLINTNGFFLIFIIIKMFCIQSHVREVQRQSLWLYNISLLTTRPKYLIILLS